MQMGSAGCWFILPASNFVPEAVIHSVSASLVSFPAARL